MYIIFMIILAAMFAIVPVIDAVGLFSKRPDPKDDISTVKCKEYVKTIAFLWGFVAPVFIMSIIGGISLADIGFSRISFNHNIWFTAIVIVLAVGLVIYEFVLPLVRIKKTRAQIMNDPEEDINEYPQTTKEKVLYSIQTLCSGICEETAYRGFLLFLLYAVFPGMPIFVICLIAFVAFAIGHIYQGWQDAVMVGLFGVLSMCLLIVTGSLIPSIVLHFFGDFAPAFYINRKQDVAAETGGD